MRFLMVDRHCGTGVAVAFTLLLVFQHCCIFGVAGLDVPMRDLSHQKTSGRPQGRRLATQQWCIAKPNLDNANYQGALDWVCGPLSGQGQVNCGPLQAGQNCYLPNTYQGHASWAFNLYFQTHGQTSQACDFQGTGVLTTTDPSTATCPYMGTNGSTSIILGNSTRNTAGHHTIHSGSYLSALVSIVAYVLTAQAY